MSEEGGTYISIGAAAKVLGLTPKFLTAMAARGELPGIIRFGNRKFFDREQFSKAVEALKKQANNRAKWA